MRILLSAILGLALMAASAFAQEENPRDLRTIWNEGVQGYLDGDFETFRDRMLEAQALRPYYFPINYNVAVAYALTGEVDESLTQFELLAARGLAVELEDDDLAALEGEPRFEALHETFAANVAPLGASETVAAFPMTGVLAEGVAVDTATGAMYISAVRAGTIWRVSADGSLETFVAPDADPHLGGILGITVDNARGLLWATSSPADPYRGPNRDPQPRSALFGFDLETGALRHLFVVPGDSNAFLGEVVLDADGDVYVSDSLDPVIYHVNEEMTALEPAITHEGFRNLQGFDFAEDGRMYIADYSFGIFVHDFASGESRPLDTPHDVYPSGIDALFVHEGDLIGIQNGITPHRIVRMDLSEDGTAIERLDVIARGLEGWSEPTLGQIVDGTLIYNAASGWPLFGPDGEPQEGAELPGIHIMQMELD